MKRKETLEWINQALARGYCSDRNRKKILDSDLIVDMAKEVYDEGIRQRAHIILP